MTRLGERCCLCDGPMRPRFCRHGHAIVECGACGHRCVAMDIPDDHVRRVYGPEYFKGGKAGYADYLDEAALLKARGQFYGEVLRGFLPPGARVLDVGCAAGLVADGVRLCGYEVEGVEPSPGMAAHARDRLGLTVHVRRFEDFVADRPYDAVLMLQVLAHFVLPAAAVRTAAAALRPGGLLVIETWDRESRTARLFGRFWHEYSPPSILHWFRRVEVRALCSRCGFSRVGGGRPRRRVALTHAVSLLGHSLGVPDAGFATARLLARLRMTAAIPYPGDDLFYEVFSRE